MMVDLHEEFGSSRRFHEARVDRRTVDELIGLAEGITADGKVNQAEAEFLMAWLKAHTGQLNDPVVNILYRRLNSMLKDGVLDDAESAELLELLCQLTGVPKRGNQLHRSSTTLPLDAPQPDIRWQDHWFVFTGIMAYGPRRECEKLVENRGGLTANTVSRKVNYLVVGDIGNEQWLHSSYGTKIKKAVELREAGSPLAIISEKHWQVKMFW